MAVTTRGCATPEIYRMMVSDLFGVVQMLLYQG